MAVTLSRTGLVNGNADNKELYQKLFVGEVMTAFADNNVMTSLQQIRTIESGKGADFPVVGTATAAYHTPGAALDSGQQIKNFQRTILIDGQLIAHTWIANIDEAMQSFELRSHYARELGIALANKYDQDSLQVAVLAARATTNYIGDSLAARLIRGASLITTAADLQAAFFTAAKTWAALNVPENDRYAILAPVPYFLLAQNTAIFNRDYGTSSGDFSRIVLPPVAGIRPILSNHVPSTVIEADAAEANTYSGTFTGTVGVFLQKQAMGTVKLLDVATEQEYQALYQATLLTAKYAVGHGILRPECAIEILATDPGPG